MGRFEGEGQREGQTLRAGAPLQVQAGFIRPAA
jgi:hypothetical protein